MTDTADPLARFAVSGEHLDPTLRSELLALGAGAIPGLLRYVEDESLWLEDAPGSGWPPIHAVSLLAELRASEAVGPMLRALRRTTWEEILHDRLVQDLPKLGAAVLEPALAELGPDTSEDERHALCCVLAKLGIRDPRIYPELCRLFDEDVVVGAACLSDYGDLAALPLIVAEIEHFVPEHDQAMGMLGLGDLVDSHERLAGPLPPALRAHVDGLYAEWEREHARAEPVRRAEKVGRNDPCPCGSGLKFKKCCIDKTAAGGEPVHQIR